MSAAAALRLVFMGTPDFAVPSLAALIAAGFDIAAVYTQPPRPAGRGHREQLSPVHRLALDHAIPVFTPASLKGATGLAVPAIDLAVVAAYGLILPRAVLEAPRLGCLNVHASLLPRWRGAAPIQRAIEAGDAETGICLMRMEAGLDTGPVYARRAIAIAARETGGSLHDRLAALGAAMLPDAVRAVAAGLAPVPQPDEGVTYARKLERAEGRIDWRLDAALLDRRIRAFTPFPGAFLEIGGERLKVLEAVPEVAAASAGAASPVAAPGTVLDDRFLVACGKGALRILAAQRPGRAAMAAGELLRGFPVAAGQVLDCPATG